MVRPRGLRVIAGTAKGRRLSAPRGATTRPMTERVRESVFSALEARGRLRDAAVLDLFAGSGNLSVESLSRGARAAVLVESSQASASVAEENLRLVGMTNVARVVTRSVSSFLLGPVPKEAPFDLVFLDPPYSLPDADVAELLRLGTRDVWVGGDAICVVHRRSASPVPPPGWSVVWERIFGDTLLVFVAPEAPKLP